MYSHNYNIPTTTYTTYRNDNNYVSSNNYSYPYNGSDDDRFFLAPFLVGGLAGTALGYGIANNNQMNGNCCGNFYPPMYGPVLPVQYPISTSNNYFY